VSNTSAAIGARRARARRDRCAAARAESRAYRAQCTRTTRPAKPYARQPAHLFVIIHPPPFRVRAPLILFATLAPSSAPPLRRQRQVAGAPADHVRGPLPLAQAAQNTAWVRVFTLRGAGCSGAALRALFLARSCQRPKPRSARVPHRRVQAHSTQGARAARLSRLDFEVCSLPVPQARAHRARVRLARWLACAPPTADSFTSSLCAQAPTCRLKAHAKPAIKAHL